MGKYDDLMNLPAYKSEKRPQMKRSERAKQFMPFAPLKTFDAAIEEAAAAIKREPESSAAFDTEWLSFSD